MRQEIKTLKNAAQTIALSHPSIAAEIIANTSSEVLLDALVAHAEEIKGNATLAKIMEIAAAARAEEEEALNIEVRINPITGLLEDPYRGASRAFVAQFSDAGERFPRMWELFKHLMKRDIEARGYTSTKHILEKVRAMLGDIRHGMAGGGPLTIEVRQAIAILNSEAIPARHDLLDNNYSSLYARRFLSEEPNMIEALNIRRTTGAGKKLLDKCFGMASSGKEIGPVDVETLAFFEKDDLAGTISGESVEFLRDQIAARLAAAGDKSGAGQIRNSTAYVINTKDFFYVCCRSTSGKNIGLYRVSDEFRVVESLFGPSL